MVNVYVGLMQYPDYSHVFLHVPNNPSTFLLVVGERGFCECLKGLGYQENTWFFTSLVFGRTTTNSVFQMVVFLWGFTVLFGFLSSYGFGNRVRECLPLAGRKWPVLFGPGSCGGPCSLTCSL